MSAWIKMLQPGKELKILKEDWKGKQPLYYLANYIAKKEGWVFKQGRLPMGEGWVIIRVK